ncbi:hypothetical protein H5P36_19045 [Bacillus sp. APMAM]|nr:hypothetical protein [Bacillus sp. APMAM]RTZ54376.1 hypothetical protein EKO25_18510 [Bacillus sp. SAJ1]
MDISSELIDISTKFATLIGENTVPTVIDKITAAKAMKNKDQTINQLEEIIMVLINEKNELIKMVQAYEQELIVRKISDDDITYITEKMVPLLEELVLKSSNDEEKEKMKESIEMLKPIVSKETFNILQLLGFNFKQAIGEPLTNLLRAIIASKIPPTEKEAIELNKLMVQREIEYWKAVQNKDAFEKHLESRIE